MKSDFLFIEEFELPCRIGTTPEERAVPQIIILSLKLELPLAKAGRSDDLRDSVDYAQVITDIKSATATRVFNLAEHLAETIAEKILSYPPIQTVEVKIGKKVFAGIKSVGACIYREKQSRH